jgi:hypothetical protein
MCTLLSSSACRPMSGLYGYVWRVQSCPDNTVCMPGMGGAGGVIGTSCR